MFELTLDEMERAQTDALDELVAAAGSDVHLGRMLGLSTMTVRGWVVRGRVSKRGAVLVAQHPIFSKQFKAEDLRPDLHV